MHKRIDMGRESDIILLYGDTDWITRIDRAEKKTATAPVVTGKKGTGMLDKNGVKIQAGNIVRIEGGYFKNDNGLFFVEQDGTNPGYLMDDRRVTLRRICKNGKISTAKNALAFFPLVCFCNDRMKRMVARRWNAEHATIEVVGGVNTEHVAEWFGERAKNFQEMVRQYKSQGFNDRYVKQYVDTAKWHEDVVKRLTA